MITCAEQPKHSISVLVLLWPSGKGRGFHAVRWGSIPDIAYLWGFGGVVVRPLAFHL